MAQSERKTGSGFKLTDMFSSMFGGGSAAPEKPAEPQKPPAAAKKPSGSGAAPAPKPEAGVIDVCLDLGGDSLKIAYAFRGSDGAAAYGKVDTEGDIADVGVPAVALYDEDAREWLYGDEIDAAGKLSFVNVVRIKDLLSLLDEGNAASDKKYYREGNDFPKFYFPARRDLRGNFGAAVVAERTFKAPGFTPEKVCEEYFARIKKLIYGRLPEIASARLGMKSAEEYEKLRLRVSVVHSPGACDTYIKELCRIVTEAFGGKPHRVLSTTKALSMYAFINGMIGRDDEMLVFDLGEENLSVAKAALVDGTVTIEGEEGHTPPLKLGGADVDEALVKYIESTIAKRETPGTPSFGEEGHLVEEGLQAKQYVLMKELKQAKVLLSRSDSHFAGGVPITVWRELCIRRTLTRGELTGCLGINDCTGVAKRIVDFIITEMSSPLNNGVKKIFLSGGIANTCGLIELIQKKLAESGFGRVTILSIPSVSDDMPDLYIYKYEATAYAAAAGGALVALTNCEVKATLSLSYGTFVYLRNRAPKVLKLFVSRGTPLKDGRNEFWSNGDGRPTQLTPDEGAISDEFFSCIITHSDIAAERYKNTDITSDYGILYKEGYPILDEPKTASRERAERTIALKSVVSGDIILMYKGEHITMDGVKLLFREGISVDSRGRAEPIIDNVTPGKLSGVMRFYRKGDKTPYRSEYKTIPAKDIDLVFSGFDEFKVNKG